MTRYYYTDPCAASYMWSNFGVEFTTFHGVWWRYDPEDDFPELHWGGQPPDEHPENIYIHPDSEEIFKPQVGDAVNLITGRLGTIQKVVSQGAYASLNILK